MGTVLQYPVPPKLLVHIGDITVSFALLESSIRTLIGSLIREHQRIGQIITAELAFKNLRALAISLYKERHDEDADFSTLKELMKRAAMLRKRVTGSLTRCGQPGKRPIRSPGSKQQPRKSAASTSASNKWAKLISPP